MLSISRIRQKRMSGLREIRKAQRNLDSKVEILERWMKRALKWKRKVPGQDDILIIQGKIREIDNAFSTLVNVTAGVAASWIQY